MRAEKLLERSRRGPIFNVRMAGGFSEEQVRYIESSYRAWFETWIEEDLETLVPELRTAKRKREAAAARGAVSTTDYTEGGGR